MSNIEPFPYYKVDASPDERLSELQAEALANPHKFAQMVCVYQETLPNNRTRVRYISSNCSTNELIGLLEVAKIQLYEDTCRSK